MLFGDTFEQYIYFLFFPNYTKFPPVTPSTPSIPPSHHGPSSAPIGLLWEKEVDFVENFSKGEKNAHFSFKNIPLSCSSPRNVRQRDRADINGVNANFIVLFLLNLPLVSATCLFFLRPPGIHLFFESLRVCLFPPAVWTLRVWGVRTSPGFGLVVFFRMDHFRVSCKCCFCVFFPLSCFGKG